MILRKLVLAAMAASATGSPSVAQNLSLSAALSPRGLPAGVSIPTIAPTDLVYPGCPTPPTSFGNVWHFDPSGSTMNTYTGLGVSLNPLVTPHQGDATHPWNSFQAVLTLQSGYTTPLLSTVSGSTGPIQAGDEVLLNSGSYGKITTGSSPTVNSPALTVAAASGQTPVFSNLLVNKTTGFVFNGIKLQSLNDDGNPLFGSGDGGGAAMSNIVLNNMDISSASVATTDGWTQAQWLANARTGVLFIASDLQTNLSCVSVVNSHIYGVQQHNFSAIVADAQNALVMNNQIDHFSTWGIEYTSSNEAFINNYIHDAVNVNPGSGDQYISINNSGTAIVGGPPQSNIFISKNKAIESIDAGQTFQAALSGIQNNNGDITNFVVIDNLIAGNGNWCVTVGNAHDGIIANNSGMYCGQIQAAQGHAGGTGPAGTATSNIRVFNNIAPVMTYYGSNVQGDHNIATGSGSVYTYVKNWGVVFTFSVPGSVTAVSSDSGVSNTIDGLGAANEFTAVPTGGSFPMSPQPDWTPKSGSPAKTFGGATLVPPITDYNGATFTPPYSIGGLN